MLIFATFCTIMLVIFIVKTLFTDKKSPSNNPFLTTYKGAVRHPETEKDARNAIIKKSQ